MQIETLLTVAPSRLRVIVLACLAAAILHILATLAAPQFAGGTPFAKLTPIAPLHKFAVLPPISPASPQSQPLAFMAPDVRYAICRYH